MAIPVIQLDNQTGSPIVLVQLGVTVPASSSIAITGQDGDVYVAEVIEDRELQTQVSDGYITLTVDTVALTQEQSLAYLNPHNDLEGIKHNMDASQAPGVNDDALAGYSVGSMWFDMTDGVTYLCFDASSGAAVWARLVGQGGNVVDEGFTYESSDGLSETTSSVWQTKVTLVTPSLGASVTCRIRWYCELSNTGSGTETEVRIILDSSTVLGEATNGVTWMEGEAGFCCGQPGSGSHTFELQYRRSAGLGSARIRRARMSYNRVE